MERRRLSHSDDGALPYLAKRRKTGFQGIEVESIRERYTVAWICALHIEMAAARAMLDEEHADCPRPANDTNSYVLGSIQNHNVVIACLPEAQYGLNTAASVLSNMRRTFPNIEIGLMVGIGGGVPLKADIRLGDIVCDLSKLETRKQRLSTEPVIYYGGIGSANTVMKDSLIRDNIARELDVLCFEMEAAGLMDIMPCLPIRGICDYSDSHKSKEWQRYAAATAAAYAYEFLELWRGGSQASYAGYHHLQSEHIMTPGRHEEILKSLNFEEIDARKSNIKAAHSKTCRWFLKHPDYISWSGSQQMPQHHGFMWIRGKPGAGKSTIMKFIYLQSKKKDRKNQSLTASFFFNARGELLERTVSGMYRSLLLQLFKGFPDLECVLDDRELLPQSRSGCPSLNVMKTLFCAAVTRLDQRSFTCFIDALDECDEQQVMELVESIEELAEQCLHDNVDLRKMLDKAAGVFLWVVLVVNILNQESRRGGLALKRRLNEVPSGLSDLFKDLLKRDATKMEELQLSIFWILLSKRPLRPEEYYHAIWSGLNFLEGLTDFDLPEVDFEDSQDCFARCVISSSKGLAEITKDKKPRVQFIHESVRDFLVKDKGLPELWPEVGPDWESVGHEKLKLCCYSYFELVTESIPDSYPLDEIVISSQPEALTAHKPSFVDEELVLGTHRYPFLEYASQSVLDHADLASNIGDQKSFLENIRISVWKRVVNSFEKHKVRRYTPGAGLLYILADRGHSSLIHTRVKSDVDIYVPSEGDRYVFPLTAAMAKGDKSSVVALLGLTSGLHDGADITERLVASKDAGFSSRTPLSWACENGYLGIAKVIVERDSQPIDAIRAAAYSPLMLASKNGHSDIARWLVNHGADIYRRYKNESAIWLATSIGHAEIVGLLLDAGADPNTCGVRDAPVLCLAVEKGHEKVVKLLLKRGADANVTDFRTKTPLHLAVKQKGSEATLQALLSCGAHINARDDTGRTPLLLAVATASIDEIGFLIRQGADVTAQDERGETCLHKVMSRSKATFEIVRLLLENGARPDARNKLGQTCLHALARRGAVIPSAGDIIQLATSRGVDINASDNAGNTALHDVTRNGELETLSTFTGQPGLDLNAPNHLGKTPLHVAASRLPLIIERLIVLIRKGAEIISLDNTSRTPLDDAIEIDHEPAILLLIENGAKRPSTESRMERIWKQAIGKTVSSRLTTVDSEVSHNVMRRSSL
ncbi:ankyrin protein 3 [Fusarium bulbicola]|nr:ankyrin protein 3 [Fusarium bulbicola]